MTLQALFSYILNFVMVITLIISFLFCYKKQNPSYLYFFPFYHLFACCIEIIIYFYLIEDYYFAIARDGSLHNLFNFGEFFFFFFFILAQLTRRMYKLILCGGGIIAFGLLLFFLLNYRSLNFPVWQGVTTTTIFFILGCILYFLNILKKLPHANLSIEPSFWIITGLFFYSVIEGPTLCVILNYRPKLTSTLLYTTINGIAYIILHLLFIKAYTCKIRK